MASMNALARRSIGLQARRVVFHAQGDASCWRTSAICPRDMPSDAREPGAGAAGLGLHPARARRRAGAWHRRWPVPDGGLTDYHLDIDYGIDEGHRLLPALLVAGDHGLVRSFAAVAAGRAGCCGARCWWRPRRFVASLPFGKIPDRRDFYTMDDATRIRAWQTVMSASERMGDELRQLISAGWLGAVQAIGATGQTTS
jgi:hypothetical protein